jgi:uncharacterized membrane protein YtjA (UPF0391 family)
MEGNILFRWLIVSIALAIIAAVFWLLRINNMVDGIAQIAFAVFFISAFALLFLDSR